METERSQTKNGEAGKVKESNAALLRKLATGDETALDRLVQQALRTMEDGARNALLAQACEIVFTDHALLPLHHEVSVWAARKGVTCETRADQYTLATGISRA